MMKTGIELIAIERQEQIEKHGFDLSHDHGIYYDKGQLIQAAEYCLSTSSRQWPVNWDHRFKIKIDRKSRIKQLTVAAALIAAEIDRIKAINHPQQG